MKKIFISQPMRGKTSDQILAERVTAIEKAKAYLNGEGVEIIDTFFKEFDGNRLEFLGRSVMEGLAKADAAVFVGDWQNYDGCRCEHFIAAQYKVPCYYVSQESLE
jgi:hypothetical protein